MDTAELTRMANQMADYFAAYDHIEKFWDPRMRRGLLDHVRAGGAGLDPLVVEASARLTLPADR